MKPYRRTWCSDRIRASQPPKDKSDGLFIFKLSGEGFSTQQINHVSVDVIKFCVHTLPSYYPRRTTIPVYKVCMMILSTWEASQSQAINCKIYHLVGLDKDFIFYFLESFMTHFSDTVWYYDFQVWIHDMDRAMACFISWGKVNDECQNFWFIF